MTRIMLALLVALGWSSVLYADALTEVVGPTTQAVRTRVVFNDAGSALTSGSVVVWDNDDTEFDRTGYPYVTTTTSADSPWVAGVIRDGNCPDQSLCEIVVEGPTRTRLAGTIVGSAAEDTRVGTSTTAGEADDYVAGTDACSVGILMENINVDTLATCNQVNCPAMVFVNPDCGA